MQAAVVQFVSTVVDFRRRVRGDVERVIRWLSTRIRRAFSNSAPAEVFYRHRLPVRITHWINALCILFLLGSGLNIFNAHPRLYWGNYGADADRPFFSIGSDDASGRAQGYAQIGAVANRYHRRPGLVEVRRRIMLSARWPDWLTIPSFQDLADARHWHFLFAWLLAINGLVYLTWSLWTPVTCRGTSGRPGADIRAIPRVDPGSCHAEASQRARRRNATMCCSGSPIWA